MKLWGLETLIRRRMRDAGFRPPKIGAHMLRHTFRVQYILQGGDIPSLMRIMGHSDVASTMLYAEMSNEVIAEQHRKFSPMSGRSAARLSGRPQLITNNEPERLTCNFRESSVPCLLRRKARLIHSTSEYRQGGCRDNIM